MKLGKNIIIDEGEEKLYPEVVKMGVSKNAQLYLDCVRKNSAELTQSEWDEDQGCMITIKHVNPDFKEMPKRIRYAQKVMNDYACDVGNFSSMNYKKLIEKSYNLFVKTASEDEIYSYLDRIPFYPCVMINISPAWKGDDVIIGDKRTAFRLHGMRKVIERYLNSCNRYSKWKYCIECGGNGDHLHAHIVAEIDPRSYKSTMTHINNGQHAASIRKYWDNKEERNLPNGLLKGKYAIHRTIIRNEEMRNDKLNYLHEEHKPEGHKNRFNLEIVESSGF